MTYRSAQVYTGSEWVDLAVGLADPNQRSIVSVSGTTKTLGESDSGKAIVFSSSSSIALTVPDDSTYNFTNGTTFILVQKGSGVVTVAGESSAVIRSKSSYVKTAGQYSEARLIKLAANEWLLSGDLSS
jgi:hypothetical protein